jgi:predicted alpha-1,2-mannosidase
MNKNQRYKNSYTQPHILLLAAILLSKLGLSQIQGPPVYPYDPSPVIKDFTINPNRKSASKEGDNWPITWADDDAQYTVYCDGEGFSAGEDYSNGITKITGSATNFSGQDIEPSNGNLIMGNSKTERKASGMLMANGTLYMWLRNLTTEGTGALLAWSSDHGKKWIYSSWNFPELGYPFWLNAGKNNEAARDEYLYFYSVDNQSAYTISDDIIMGRVHKNMATQKSSYEFFAGLDLSGNPTWTTDITQRKIVFNNPGRCFRPSMVYNPGIARYMLLTQTLDTPWAENNQKEVYLGIFDAPEPWGPWTTVKEITNWGVPEEEDRFQPQVPPKWISADGREFYLLYSCHPRGPYKFNIQKVTLTLAGDATPGLNYIDPTIGNVAPLLNPNRPVVHLPNQMVRVFPNRKDHLDAEITDFPCLALNVITPQLIFSIKPSTGEVTDTIFNRRLNYDLNHEITRPWYYATLLTDDDILVEYTAGERTGIYRFSFPENVEKNLLLSHYYANGSYELAIPNEIYGIESVTDLHHQQKGIAYLYGVFTGSPGYEKSEGEKYWGKYTVGSVPEKPSLMKGEKVWISYSEKDSSCVEFRYAISFISQDQAKMNYFQELDGVTFEELKNNGRSVWDKIISQIQVEGGTEGQKRSFYTALYRCYVRMVDISENGRYFSGYDNQIHEDSRSFYVDDYSWGNFIALHPLRMILNPAVESDMLHSYVRMYKQSGWMPDYPKHFGDRAGMFGFHSSIMFLDAYRKGIRKFDVEKAFEGSLKSAEQATMLPSRNGPKGMLENFYNVKGYYPALHPGEKETDPLALGKPGQKRSAVAITLAHSYDSWALSEMAKELGNSEVNRRFVLKSRNYKNLYWAEKGFFMPKDADGNWIEIDPKFDGGRSGLDYYNENNGWAYLWYVQHDIEGLIALMGGKNPFENRLDLLFREGLDRSKFQFWAKFPDQTGLIGNFSMGNQVSFHIPYLFNYTASPWKTQKWTRLILDTWFQDNIFGVPGDEDGGSMSAFVVFSSMGFYPIKPGIPIYTITSPVFSKVSINLQNGKTFKLIAKNSSKINKYIQSAELNGIPLDAVNFSHNDLMNGGILILEMGEKPSNWGIQK